MKSVVLGFDPNTLEPGPLKDLFTFKGPALKFWLLWRGGHICSNKFNSGLLVFHFEFQKITNLNMDTYVNCLGWCVPEVEASRGHLINFVAEHWGYLNPKFNWKIQVKMETDQIVTTEVELGEY